MEKVKCSLCDNESEVRLYTCGITLQEVDLENGIIHYIPQVHRRATLCVSCNKAYAKYVIENLSNDKFNETFNEFTLKEINEYMAQIGVINDEK